MTMSEAVFQNISKLYGGVTDLVIRYENYIITCIRDVYPGVYRAVMCRLTELANSSSLSVRSCDTERD